MIGVVRPEAMYAFPTSRRKTSGSFESLVEARGAWLLDAPVSGTLEPARQGQLLAMVGGRAEDLGYAAGRENAFATLAGEAVEVGGRTPGLQLRFDEGENLGHDPAGGPHLLDLAARLAGHHG